MPTNPPLKGLSGDEITSAGSSSLAATSTPCRPDLPQWVGATPALERIRQLIARVAPTDRPLLISGPTGSGKELVAQRVHAASTYPQAAFIDVNCGAIPENLVEAELFGHTKGAYTGAANSRSGYFGQVGKGTLFLDEIGELPLALQPKLLRVLETRTYRPVGGNELLKFEGRILAATHRDLKAMVAEGRFREDLYYRLAVFVVDLPGLDERRDDIPALIDHFVAQQPRRLSFSAAAVDYLRRQAWPGNIRQLRNLVDQLAVLAPTPAIDVDDLLPFLQPAEGLPESAKALADALLRLPGDDKLLAAESLLIDRALQLSNGNKSAAAQRLGVSRKVVERRLKAREIHGLEAQKLLEQGRHLVEAAQYRAAIGPLRRCLDRLEDQADAGRLQFEAYRLLGVSLRSVNGWLCAEARACYEHALRIGESCCNAEELTTIQFGIWTTQLMTLDLGLARATAHNMLQRAQGMASQPALDEAHAALANTLFWLGDCEEALACLTRGGLVGLGPEEERMGMQGFDIADLALTFEGLSAFRMGGFIQAREAMETLILRAGPHRAHPFNRTMALQGATWLLCLFEDMERLGELAALMEGLASQHGFEFYQGIAQFFRGRVLGYRGDEAQAELEMVEGYEAHMLSHGGQLFHSFQAWHRGEVLLQARNPRACLEMVEQALDMALQQQDRAYLGDMLVVKARAQWALGEVREAEHELRSALSTAQALGSVSARISAAYHLADLLRHARRPAQAAETLSRALRATERTGGSPALGRALALLAELRPPLSSSDKE